MNATGVPYRRRPTDADHCLTRWLGSPAGINETREPTPCGAKSKPSHQEGRRVPRGQHLQPALSKATVKSFAEAMSRGDWKVTHQGIAFSIGGVLVDGSTDSPPSSKPTFPWTCRLHRRQRRDPRRPGHRKRRNAADVLALEGEKSVTMLAAMVRSVWLHEYRPDLTWSGGSAVVTNHQVVETLAAHPKLRDFIVVGDQLSVAIGMIKSAAGAPSYRVSQANPKADLIPWFDGVTEGAGLAKGDSRLMLRRVMFNMTRKREGQPKRRRDTREHVGLYFKAFNA